MKYIMIVFLFVSFSSVAISQETKDLASYPGKWIYANNNLSNEWFSEKFYKMNTTELQKYHSTIEKLVNYLHQQPVAQNPLGANLNVQSRASYIKYDHERFPVKPNERVKVEIYIPFCYFYERNGKIGYSCDESPSIKLRTNDISMAFKSIMSDNNLTDKQV